MASGIKGFAVAIFFVTAVLGFVGATDVLMTGLLEDLLADLATDFTGATVLTAVTTTGLIGDKAGFTAVLVSGVYGSQEGVKAL
jgi:hypothetical protein